MVNKDMEGKQNKDKTININNNIFRDRKRIREGNVCLLHIVLAPPSNRIEICLDRVSSKLEMRQIRSSAKMHSVAAVQHQVYPITRPFHTPPIIPHSIRTFGLHKSSPSRFYENGSLPST